MKMVLAIRTESYLKVNKWDKAGNKLSNVANKCLQSMFPLTFDSSCSEALLCSEVYICFRIFYHLGKRFLCKASLYWSS